MNKNIGEYIDGINDLVVRAKIQDSLLESVLPVVDCIFENDCEWYGDDDKSADQIAGCLHEYIDYSDYTEDEFEFVLRWLNYFCAIKYAYMHNLLKEDEKGCLNIPKAWKEKLGI